MHVAEIGAKLHRPASSGTGVRVDAAADLAPENREINQGLHAHRLDDVDRLVEIVLVGLAVRSGLRDVLWPQSQYQVRLADMGLVTGRAIRRHRGGELVAQP